MMLLDTELCRHQLQDLARVVADVLHLVAARGTATLFGRKFMVDDFARQLLGRTAPARAATHRLGLVDDLAVLRVVVQGFFFERRLTRFFTELQHERQLRGIELLTAAAAPLALQLGHTQQQLGVQLPHLAQHRQSRIDRFVRMAIGDERSHRLANRIEFCLLLLHRLDLHIEEDCIRSAPMESSEIGALNVSVARQVGGNKEEHSGYNRLD